MLYYSEELFIDKFIACMKLSKIAEFPFDNNAFYSGVDKMRCYFQDNRESAGEDASELSLLFMKNPIEGIYSRFREAISDQNGDSVSFENPEYVKGSFKLTEQDAQIIMDMEQDYIPNSFVKNMAEKFCEGAGLK